ncbi:MAG TPA: outer membrane lipoprotein LolB [Usitatibacter sp.]|nr:outer membrane lipoprotein LolB [Usitatibacter sp.]
MIARAAAAVLALVLGACALAPPRQTTLPDLAGVPAAFEMSGRLALRQGERSEIARLRWTHRPGTDLWVFASPLGNEVARIESGPGGATLTQAVGGGAQADSFAELTERVLGVTLAPETLATWLHGNSAPGPAAGWSISIEERQKAGVVDIARRLSATRGDVTVRLVVDDYRALD